MRQPEIHQGTTPATVPGASNKKENRPHNRRDSPHPVDTQRDGALPDSSTFLTLYLDPARQVDCPAGSVTSECGPSRFTRKVCIVKQVRSPSRAELGARRIPIRTITRWQVDEIRANNPRGADQI